MALFLFCGLDVSGRCMVGYINQIFERGDFSTTSKFYEWSSRWKLIQLRRYPRIDRLLYAMKVWSKTEQVII